jgi:bacteriocin-like protein
MSKTNDTTPAINTAATSQRELTNEELDAVSGGERSNSAEAKWATFETNIGSAVMTAAFVLVGTFF